MSSEPQRPVVAIAGATGSLGQHITETLLEPAFFSQLSSIVLLSRKKQEESRQLQEWAGKGAKVVVYDEKDLAGSLTGVDVLINVIGAGGDESKDRLVKALSQTKVRMYFPSEFGVDHTLHEFPNKTWDFKRRHMDHARRIASERNAEQQGSIHLKVCRVFIGLFLEDLIPELGLDIENFRLESVGPVDTKISYTSMDDVGKILAVLATMSTDKLTTVPETIRLSGTDASIKETASYGMMVTGRNVLVESVDGPSFKRNTLESEDQNPYPYLRFLMGDGSIDYRAKSRGGLGNDNELINPKETKFQWKTLLDLLYERLDRLRVYS